MSSLGNVIFLLLDKELPLFFKSPFKVYVEGTTLSVDGLLDTVLAMISMIMTQRGNILPVERAKMQLLFQTVWNE